MDSPTGLGICRLSDGLRKALLEDTSSDSCGELGDLKGCEPGSGEEGEPANLCSSSGFQPLSLSATAVQQLDTRQPRRASQPACSAHQAADQHPAAINVPWLHQAATAALPAIHPPSLSPLHKHIRSPRTLHSLISLSFKPQRPLFPSAIHNTPSPTLQQLTPPPAASSTAGEMGCHPADARGVDRGGWLRLAELGVLAQAIS